MKRRLSTYVVSAATALLVTSASANASAEPSDGHLAVGMGVEHFGKNAEGFGRVRDILVGPTVAYRAASFEPHFELMLTPAAGTWENLRLLGSLGARYYLPAPKNLGLSIGWSIHAEARLEDHYWLASLTPLELGATIYEKRSLHVQLFTGLRAGFAGSLLDSFLIDPNGFRNADAQEALDDASLRSPWRLFLRVVFSRRIH